MTGKKNATLLRSILIATALSLSSCATQKQEIAKAPAPTGEPEESGVSTPSTANLPSQTSIKNGRELRLVRIMDGGACNPEDQGARGLFLVYADPEDIERIKKEKGTPVFEQFEQSIEGLSLEALQESVDAINFSDNPFALDLEDAVHQVAERLIANFRRYAEPAIDNFEAETTLTIDVIPFSPSIGFILENCEDALSETPESE